MTACQFLPGDDPAPVLALIREAFAYMDGRIDPPSSMHRVDEQSVIAQATSGEVWLIGPRTAPLACVFLTPKPPALYLGKLAVTEAARGTGLARVLVDKAAERARALGLSHLTLQTRVELTRNHATFRALGFDQTGASSHPGFDKITSFTFTKVL